MQDLHALRREADDLVEAEKYEEAYEAYDALTRAVLLRIKQTKTTRQVSKAAGWAAALLTGGLGLEDVLIVPLVNKAMLSWFGIKIEDALSILLYAISQKLLLLQVSEPVLGDTPLEVVLADFALAFKLTHQDDEDFFEGLLALANPFAEDSPVQGDERSRTIDQLVVQLRKEVEADGPIAEYLSNLLFLYLLIKDERKTGLYTYLRKERVYIEASFDAARTARAAAHRDDTEQEQAFGRLLGLCGRVTRADIKRLYREQVMACHPDRLQHLPESERRDATQRVRELNEAYAYFRQKYAF